MIQELERKLEKMDKQLESNRNADIRRFTYVTVIFLPLGFATGVFSMSGAPSGSTLGNMIITAVAAFAITALLILCVTNLDVIRYYCWYAGEHAVDLKDDMVDFLDEVRKKWGNYRLAKKPTDENEEAQRDEDEIQLVTIESRSKGASIRNGRESRDSERRSWHSEGSIHLQMEPVRSSDNIV